MPKIVSTLLRKSICHENKPMHLLNEILHKYKVSVRDQDPDGLNQWQLDQVYQRAWSDKGRGRVYRGRSGATLETLLHCYIGATLETELNA